MTTRFKAPAAVLLVMLTVIFGLGVSATVATAEPATGPAAAPSLTSSGHSGLAPYIAVRPNDVGPWTAYEWPFKSYGSCETRGAWVLSTYGGNHYGAIKAYTCAGFIPPVCPPKQVIALFVRYDIGVGGGGGGGWLVKPNSTPQAACAV